ncbi:MAG: XRE family transcriptional regulator [Bacteroidia bacterium]|nr:XRE family transcriptional regulator [Bacteroidia bacterium]
MNRLGERIKRKREMLSLPLSDLSKRVGISVSALSQIENSQYFLEKGDNFYFNSTILHSLKNIHNSPAKVLWIVSPPNI